MTTTDQSSPNWENYYLRLREKLLGRELPIVASDTDFPPPSGKSLEQHAALISLLKQPAFGIFFTFMREENEREDAKLKASSATDSELRAHQAERGYLEKIARATVDFVAEVDRNLLARAKWLETQQNNSQSGVSLPPIPAY